ncbi:MAG: hypothetical protein AAB209_11405 [Bacteroidota bacterium]
MCSAPCEVECRRCSIDDSITIRALKRFVTGQFGAGCTSRIVLNI